MSLSELFDLPADTLVVRPVERDTEKIVNGIVLVYTGEEAPPTVGTVECTSTESHYVVGDKVLFSPWSGFTLVVGGVNYRYLTESDILARMKRVVDVGIQ